jgi:hypothetical protein
MVTRQHQPDPFSLFQGKVDSLHEVVQTVYVAAGENEYKVEVRRVHHDSATAPPYVIRYFIKRGNQFVDDDTELPWADGRTPDDALTQALGFLSDKHPRKLRRV